jgi:hypothetical protein
MEGVQAGRVRSAARRGAGVRRCSQAVHHLRRFRLAGKQVCDADMMYVCCGFGCYAVTCATQLVVPWLSRHARKALG